MDTAIADALIASGSEKIFLSNRLVVILPGKNPGGITNLEELNRPGLKVILAAEEVPAGQYARQALDNLASIYGQSFPPQVLSNLASNEDNVRQVVAKIQLGEADAGIVYASDAVAAPELLTIQIPEAYNVTARYPIAVLKSAPEPELASSFVAFVLSPAGQKILKEWGFSPVTP